MGKSKDLATGETRFVNTSGDTMTGNLAINNASGSQVTLHRSDTTIVNDDLVGQIIMSGDDADTDASGTRGFIRGRSQGTGGGLKMEFGTAGGGVVIGDPRMTINADGHVTTPNQPCFAAGGNFGWQDVGSSYGKPTPWRTNQTGQFNSGMWNNSTGRATAPVAGRYQFNLNIYVNNSGEYFHYGRLYLNGSAFAGTMLHLGDTSNDFPDETMGASFIVNMSANDYVEYYHVEDIYGYHSSFSGFLIG
jgi:hypothetical protein